MLHLVAADITGAAWTTRLKPLNSPVCSSASASFSGSGEPWQLLIFVCHIAHGGEETTIARTASDANHCGLGTCTSPQILLYSVYIKKYGFFLLLTLLSFLFKSTWSSVKVSQCFTLCFSYTVVLSCDNLTNKCPERISWFLSHPWLPGCQLTHLSIFEAGSRRELGMCSFCGTQSRAG